MLQPHPNASTTQNTKPVLNAKTKKIYTVLKLPLISHSKLHSIKLPLRGLRLYLSRYSRRSLSCSWHRRHRRRRNSSIITINILRNRGQINRVSISLMVLVILLLSLIVFMVVLTSHRTIVFMLALVVSLRLIPVWLVASWSSGRRR